MGAAWTEHKVFALRRQDLIPVTDETLKTISLFAAAHECLGLAPFVWTGRALQAECDDLEMLVLRFCIRPLNGAFALLAIMDIRAHPISF
jgi:hypothetical protein